MDAVRGTKVKTNLKGEMEVDIPAGEHCRLHRELMSFFISNLGCVRGVSPWGRIAGEIFTMPELVHGGIPEKSTAHDIAVDKPLHGQYNIVVKYRL